MNSPALEIQAATEAVRRNPKDLNALFRLGGLLHDAGDPQRAEKIRSQIVAVLAHFAKEAKNPDLVSNLLVDLYSSFARKIESEQHVRTCFQSWLSPVVQFGRKLKDTALPHDLWETTAQRPWRAAFFLRYATILGHTEAMLEVLSHLPRQDARWHEQPLVYVFEGRSEELDSRVSAAGGRTVNLQAEMQPSLDLMSRIRWLRNHIAEENVSHLVWVSSPPTAEFLLSMRIAPVQTFWTLKFHPFQIPEIDGYISYGAWSERERIVHGERWDVLPFVISKPSSTVAESDVAAARQPFEKYNVLFGTLARTEKMNSRPFLNAVVQILKANPGAAFLWTGREKHKSIEGIFDAAGVGERCHFIGWVDTPVYARALDIFLESFPFGCGLTGIQALEAGTAFVSYAAPETLYGMHFIRPLKNKDSVAEIRALLDPSDGSAPLLYAKEPAEYVKYANHLASSAEYRRAIGLAGQSYYRRHLADSDRMGRQFLEILTNTKAPKTADQ